jgi:hypothetical protein
VQHLTGASRPSAGDRAPTCSESELVNCRKLRHSRALDFTETDLDAGAYNLISAWVARAIREIGEDLARVQATDPEAVKGLAVARLKVEGGKLWLRIFTQIQEAIPRYAPAGEG